MMFFRVVRRDEKTGRVVECGLMADDAGGEVFLTTMEECWLGEDLYRLVLERDDGETVLVCEFPFRRNPGRWDGSAADFGRKIDEHGYEVSWLEDDEDLGGWMDDEEADEFEAEEEDGEYYY